MTKRANTRARKQIAAINNSAEVKAEAQQTEAQQTEADADELEAMEAERLKLEANQTEALKTEAESDLKEAEAQVEQQTEQTVKTEQEVVKTEQEVVKTEQTVTLDPELSPEQQLAAIKEAKAKLAEQRKVFLEQREKEKAALKIKRDLEKELAALEAEQKAFEQEQSSEVTLDDDDDANESADIKGSDYKVSAKLQDELFIKSLAANGNSVEKIGILREYWKKHSAEFRAIASEKQQKAIMRRTLNRLRLAKVCDKDGMKIFLIKTEASK